MVQLADTQKTPANGVGSALNGRNRLRSHFDDLLTSPEELSKHRLADELASELWSRLPISRAGSESEVGGIDHVIRIATASSTQVATWYQELTDFVPAIARAATVYRGGQLSDALQADLNADIQQQMLEHVQFPLPSRSFVDFKFADLPPAEAWTQAHRRLEQACLEFANHVFALFDTLQQKKIVGQIQETSSTCRFTFFRRVAILTGTQKRIEKRRTQDTDRQMFGRPALFDETLETTSFEVLHRHAQHVHHMRNPTLSDPAATLHPLPVKYQQLIDACPNWMSDSIRVLEGELFRDECIEWDLHSDTRTDEKVIERVRRDPAILFGPYVLAGWGELAITEEETRQREKQNDASRKEIAKQARLIHLLSFLVAGLAIAVIPFTGWATTVTTSLAILIGLVAMVLAGKAAHLESVARQNLSPSGVLLHSTLIGTTVFAVQGLLFSVLHWSLPALGIATPAAVIAAIAFTLKSAGTEWDGVRVG